VQRPSSVLAVVRRRRVLLPILLGVAVVAAAGVATAALVAADAEARRLLDRADGLLHPAFAEAPTLDGLDAASALGALEEARAQGLPPGTEARFRGLSDRARGIDHLRRGELVFARDSLEALRQQGSDGPLVRLLGVEVARAAEGEGDRVSPGAHDGGQGRGGQAGSGVSEQLSAALDAYPDDPRLRLVAADVTLDAGDAAAADEALRRLAAVVPDAGPARAVVHNRRGLLWEARGDRARARAAYRRATQADPRQADARVNLGRLAMDAGDHPEALRWFAEVLVDEPTHPRALFGRGLAHLAAGRLDAAHHDFLEAAVGAPDDPEVRLALGDVARARGEVDRALVAYREAVALDEEDPVAWLRLGNALVEGKEPAAAAEAFAEALRRDPELAAAHNGLGVARMLAGDAPGARAAFVKAASLDPDDPNPRRNLARL